MDLRVVPQGLVVTDTLHGGGDGLLIKDVPEGTDPHTALQKLRQLSEEDPQLHILWNERLQQIHVRLMGQVQLEVLRRLIARRFGLRKSYQGSSRTL